MPPQSPLDVLATEIGTDVARIERGMRERAAGLEEMIARGFENTESRVAAIEARLTEPARPEPLVAPDEIAPLIARAAALLAEAPPLAVKERVPPAPVVNVTLPPQPAPRTERSRVQHDAQGRVVAIERDIA